ncbi:MAG: DUF1847 domain-containing protein [Pseudomonadota bacterium]
MVIEFPRCARCVLKRFERVCQNENAKPVDDCPTIAYDETIRQSVATLREEPGILNFARQASIQEGEGFNEGKPVTLRIAETIAFAQKMKFSRLGLAFCIELQKEARIVEALLTEKGFEVASASCKVGRTPKSVLDLEDHQTLCGHASEAMGNPVAQAMLLNEVKTEFNIVMGLCVGHDSMFFKYADAPSTVLVAKDRVLGHNPMAAVYTFDTYYQSLK